ncbi:MAG: hypothetical protein HYW48_01035 [Deltaproteobacteria bacterium]|nr:hypothetical protein [Deltaproteobacteria bacterium]
MPQSLQTTSLPQAAIIFLVVCCCPLAAQAYQSKWQVKGGVSAFFFGTVMPPQGLLLAGYQWDFDTFFHEVNIGGWRGNRGTDIAYWQVAGVQPLPKGSMSFGAGLGWISHDETSALGSRWQFILDIRYRWQDLPYYFGMSHISNGELFFHHAYLPNVGENFFVFGYEF